MKPAKILSLLCFAVLTSCTSQVSDNYVIQTLERAVENGSCLYAMQDALCYGQNWHPEENELEGWSFESCDIKDVTGDYPAIVGFDLGGIELGNKANLDGVNFDFMRNAAITHASRGGIVTFSWHLRNPLTGGDAWDVSSNQVVKSVLDGGECHEMFMDWLGNVADFLNSCRASNGELIPVIFRPWHENTGSWFWWGAALSTQDDYKALWQMTYDFLAKERGLEMTWAYSPSQTMLKEESLQRYPGDEIIDIIGVDRYAQARAIEVNPLNISGMQEDLSFLAAFAKEHSLLLAVTETGQEGQTCPSWWTEELMKGIEGQPVCYVLTWRNAWDPEHPGHWFSSFKGAENEDDFLKFYNSEKTSFINDIKPKKTNFALK